MEGFPSGQREQTVNLSSMTSVVRIHHLPPKEPILIRVSVLFWCQVEWIRKPALRNVPVARFNRRGFAAAKRIHHRTGRQACGSAVMRLHQTLKLDTRPKRSVGSWKRAGGTFQPAWLARRPTTSKIFNGCSRSESESTTGRVGRHVAVRPRAAIASPGRRTPNPKERTGCSIAKSTCIGYWEQYIAICDVIP